MAQYAEIIKRLQGEVSDLRGQLSVERGTSQELNLRRNHSVDALPSLKPLTSKNRENEPDFLRLKDEIEKHFLMETKSKKRIHELEQKQETAKLSIINKNNEVLSLKATKLQSADTHVATETTANTIADISPKSTYEFDKQINQTHVEIKETQVKIASFGKSLEECS